VLCRGGKTCVSLPHGYEAGAGLRCTRHKVLVTVSNCVWLLFEVEVEVFMDEKLTGANSVMAVNHFSFEDHSHARATVPDSTDLGIILFPVSRGTLDFCTKTSLFSGDIVSLA
jgi:hypothetical protein